MHDLINKANGVKGTCSRVVCEASSAGGGHDKHRDGRVTGREADEGWDRNFLNLECRFMATNHFSLLLGMGRRGEITLTHRLL